ncbi:MAG TPA: alpha/beta hydrolase [Chloroflexota bacterium]
MTATQQPTATVEPAAWQERYVDADGFHIRYLEAGQGPPLVWFHGAGGLRRSAAQDLLAQDYHMFLFEAPGFGRSPVNERSQSMQDLGRSMAEAVAALDLGRYNLLGHSFGGRLAAWLAVQAPDNVDALVLAAPAAIVPEGHVRQAAPESRANTLYAHPERLPPIPPPDPAVLAQQEALLRRVSNPRPDKELEARLADVKIPTLVLFGTEDVMIPPEMGRRYREIMPNCHYVLVYDAGHGLDADRPEAFARVVSDFLERREAFVVNRENALIDP